MLKADKSSIRPVLDKRFINSEIISPGAQVEPIEEILHHLSKAVVFSIQDLTNGVTILCPFTQKVTRVYSFQIWRTTVLF